MLPARRSLRFRIRLGDLNQSVGYTWASLQVCWVRKHAGLVIVAFGALELGF
jgi:hypothetical protein